MRGQEKKDPEKVAEEAKKEAKVESKRQRYINGANDASTVAIYNKLNNVTIGGVEYKVYETVGKSKKYLLDTY